MESFILSETNLYTMHLHFFRLFGCHLDIFKVFNADRMSEVGFFIDKV